MEYPNFIKGDTFESEMVYTREEVLDFARLTGDNNPIHIDEEFGEKSEYGRNIVHGNFVVASFSASTKYGLPGRGTIAMQKEVLFIRPVFIGERYTLITRISSINHSENRAVIKYFLKNSKGKTCVRVTNTVKNEKLFRILK